MMIHTKFTPATSAYGSHMGTCHHYPAMAEAWFDGLRDEAICVQEMGLDPAQMIEKAVAILRRRGAIPAKPLREAPLHEMSAQYHYYGI